MLASMAGIYQNKLYIVGGHKMETTILNLDNIYMNTFEDVLYQPDLNVIDGNWKTEIFWYTLPWPIFCEQKCSTQIDRYIYVVSPYKNISGRVTNSQTLFIYDMEEYKFPPIQTYRSVVPKNWRVLVF